MTRTKRAPATTLLIVAILIGFGIEVVTGAWRDPEKLAKLGAVVRPWIVEYGQYWRLVSAMFLHGDGTPRGDALHLALNLFALYQIGTLYEIMFGTKRFAAIYFISGILASITSAVVNHGPSVGASGAIFGIIGAFLSSVPRSPRWRHERMARSIVKQLIFWVVANVIIATQIPQIDTAAHMGGFAAGLLLGYFWPHRVPPPAPAQVIVDVMPYEESAADPREQRNDR